MILDFPSPSCMRKVKKIEEKDKKREMFKEN